MTSNSELKAQANLLGGLAAALNAAAEALHEYQAKLLCVLDTSVLKELVEETEKLGLYTGIELSPIDRCAEPAGMLDEEEIDISTDPDGEVPLPVAENVEPSVYTVSYPTTPDYRLLDALADDRFKVVGATIGEVAKKLGQDIAAFRPVLEGLIENGKVTKSGAKRGTRYSVARAGE